MPLYEFRCDACGETMTRLLSNWQAATAMEKEICPFCKEGVLRKQPSAPAFTVGGWNAKNGYAGVKPRD